MSLATAVALAVLFAEAPLPQPPLALLQCLPSAEAVEAQLDFARRFLEAKGGRKYPGYLMVCQSCWCWERLAEAHDSIRSNEYRRIALGQLVGLLGWRAVLEGRLPPSVPRGLVE